MPHRPEVTWPAALREAEDALVRIRREALSQEAGSPAAAPAPPGVRWGLALSGGGIRSATFCLGVLQSMAGSGVLRQFDYLSTVSGGGFSGGFLGALIQRRGMREAQNELQDDRSPTMQWLRDNGRYLAPNGATDLWAAGATMLRNWLAVQVVVASSVLFLMLLTQVLRVLLMRYAGPFWGWTEPPVAPGILPSPWFRLLLIPLLLWLIPSAWAYWLTQRATRWIPPFLGCAASIVFGVSLALIRPGPVDGWVPDYLVVAWTLGALAGCSFLFWAGATAWTCGLRLGEAFRSLSWWPVSITVVLLEGALGLTFRQLALPLASASFLLISLGAQVALILGWVLSGATQDESDRKYRQLVRGTLSRWTTAALVALGIGAILAVVDSLAQSGYHWLASHRGTPEVQRVWAAIAAGFAALSAIAPWGERLAGMFKAKPRPSLELVAGVGALVIGVGYLAGLSILAYGIRQGGHDLGQQTDLWPWPVIWLAALGGTVALVSNLFGFVNTSSLHDFYANRLVRAYLGASNRERVETSRGKPVGRPVLEDDIEHLDYGAFRRGGPLHLINVTLNETVSGRSQTEQRDRRGLPLAIGPAGLSVGVRHHAGWVSDTLPRPVAPLPKEVTTSYRVWPALGRPILPESLSLGYWMAISGAAFSTGLGFRTSTAKSVLAGLFNVRLGYWWDSGVSPEWRPRETQTPLAAGPMIGRQLARAFPVQIALADEFLARFHGPARQRWYLSDGGHFENTACYELIRRRLPVIIVCDCGADPAYHFEDLGNLVRLVRIDFGAEIRFLDQGELVARVPDLAKRLPEVGGISQLVPGAGEDGRARSQAHIAVALVSYQDAPETSLFILLKPTVRDQLPLDLLEYHQKHQEFPQQPTADQFFDEAQWESYRRLGFEIGEVLPRLLQPEVLAALGRQPQTGATA